MITLVCPICQNKADEVHEPCPVCGHSLKALRRLEWCRLLTVILGAFICACGVCMLMGLSLTIGLGPLTHWERSKFTDLFLDLRTTGFVVVAVGLLVTAGLPWWLNRWGMNQGIKADLRHA